MKNTNITDFGLLSKEEAGAYVQRIDDEEDETPFQTGYYRLHSVVDVNFTPIQENKTATIVVVDEEGNKMPYEDWVSEQKLKMVEDTPYPKTSAYEWKIEQLKKATMKDYTGTPEWKIDEMMSEHYEMEPLRREEDLVPNPTSETSQSFTEQLKKLFIFTNPKYKK